MTVSNFRDQRETTTKTISKQEPTIEQTATTAKFAWTEGVSRLSYTAGKTISLGDYQFARVGVSIEVEHGDDDYNKAFEITKYLSKEICEQETASVLSIDRENGEFKTGGLNKFRLTIDYGLTLKTGRFDSAKVDIALTRYCLESDLGSVLAEMRGILSQRVSDEAKEIKKG